jgi:SAM-dependent methyltransferase
VSTTIASHPSSGTADGLLAPVAGCWVCGDVRSRRLHEAPFDFRQFAAQDPELHGYSGRTVWFRRCASCGFTQPEALPTLPRFFDRIYDQRWAEGWMEEEFASPSKDRVFFAVLRGLERRRPPGRRLLDVGAHVGRFVYLAGQAGWTAEGVELNPRTAAFAARHSGWPVHQTNAHVLADQGRRYDAVTLIDVLEHIPEPLAVLRTLCRLVDPGGWVVVKVPCGPSQLRKERLVRLLRRRPHLNVATNLVHVNHFHPGSLRRALEAAGLTGVTVTVSAPELYPSGGPVRGWLSRLGRLGCYHLARALPGGVHTPLAFSLLAFARKPA